jgi:Polysaccharide lyase
MDRMVDRSPARNLGQAFPVVLALLIGAENGACGASLTDGFESGEPSDHVWERCKVDENYLRAVAPGARGSRQAMGLRADEALEDTNNCDEDGGRDLLGPSLFFAEGARPAAPERTQRNEARVLKEHWLAWGSDTWYGFSFRIDPTNPIPTRDSTRWVVGQWKQESGDSPVVAQRFDNGVFHVSVQDGDCRCYVALAPGDPDALRLVTREPLRCLHSPPDFTAGARPVACPTPTRLRLTAGSQRLPDPKFGWVDMVYHIRGGREPEGLVEVFANGQLAARVQGPVGYEPKGRERENFKIGMYRAWMTVEAELVFDNFRRGRSYDEVDPSKAEE